MKRICLIGGGHGTSRLLKGFKDKDVSLDIIVTSSDNGGHSGELIKEFNIPALGDLRMVLESVLNKPLLEFMSYRFKHLHGKDSVSLGNLMLASLVLEKGNVKGMLNEVNELVDEKYKFHLSNCEYIELEALKYDGECVVGESSIGEVCGIKEVFLKKEGEVDKGVIEAILNADIIVLSFGSFYTSLGAVLANKEIAFAINESKAELVYVPNLVNQKETSDYVLENYVDYLERVINRKIDRVIVSGSRVKRRIAKKYLVNGRKVVVNKDIRSNYRFYPLLVIEDDKLRHNVDYLAKIIIGEDRLG